MKIKTLHLKNAGPLNRTFDFQDDWSGDVHSRILLSGPNGSGKTFLLRIIAGLWEAVGYWLDNRKVLHRSSLLKKQLQQWQFISLVLSDFPHYNDTPVILFFGDADIFQKLRSTYRESIWIGEITGKNGNAKFKQKLIMPKESWIDDWAEARKRMILTFDTSDTPNIVYLDAEQRRWVSPKRNIGQTLPEDSKCRWLATYQATEDWQSQLEASLINLKSTKLHKYHQIIRDLNDFLYGKSIDPDIIPGKNRLQVVIKNKRGEKHSIDELSAGEHQVMIQLYMVSRWLEKGGIALIDESDLFLHPSLISGFLSKLESLIKEKNAQLILTSHNPDIWKRYERKGLRVSLGGEK